MADPEHLAKLREGVEAWNQWKHENPDITVNLFDASLSWAKLSRVDLSGANLTEAFLTEADLRWADLSRANLTRADLGEANFLGANRNGACLVRVHLNHANLSGASLIGADLRWVDFSQTNLNEADLSGADLSGARLIDTELKGANLTQCKVFGVSAWGVDLEEAIQSNLVITRESESVIQVDNLEVAQFVYLLLNNERIRTVIDTITSKVVLILGRFSERRMVLDAIRDELRTLNYLPVLFDSKKPDSKDLTGTVTTLANMAPSLPI